MTSDKAISPRLQTLMSDYQAAINHANSILRSSGLEEPLASSIRTLPQSGALPGGETYFWHGIGVEVKWPGGSVDFDFDVPVGSDHGQLLRYAKSKQERYGYITEKELAAELSDAKNKGLLPPGWLVHEAGSKWLPHSAS